MVPPSPRRCQRRAGVPVSHASAAWPRRELHANLFQRYAAVRLAPVGPVIDEVLGARGIEPPPE